MNDLRRDIFNLYLFGVLICASINAISNVFSCGSLYQLTSPGTCKTGLRAEGEVMAK